MRLNQAVCRAAAAVVGAAALLVGATLPSLPLAEGAVAGQRAASGMPADPANGSGLRPPAVSPQVVAPRVAFTDDRDEIVEVDRHYPGSFSTVVSGPRHVGEASGRESGDRRALVFVSTLDEPTGEVYARRSGSGASNVRLTCNTAVETHPVLSPDGTKLAYASNESGSFQIWVEVYDPEVPLDPGPDACPRVSRLQVTHDAGENLWPAWAGDDELVFESTRADPLGDLYRVAIPDPSTPVADGDAVRLTDSPDAETQPAAVEIPGPITLQTAPPSTPAVTSWAVVFTTTQFRPDGSLASIPLPGQGDAIPPVTSVWPDGQPRQSSEAALRFPNEITYTTTQDDSYGDVRFAVMTDLRIQLSSDSVVAGEPGWAESHPGFGNDLYGAGILLTRAVHPADVSDVVASDGSARRTVAAGAVPGGGPRDESTPAYSPDGDRIAYSRMADSGGREIVTANADGSNVLVPEANRPENSYDTEPAWSPDGTRIAFVRFPKVGAAIGNSEIWVVDLSSGASRRVSTPSSGRYWDENPSWSPDGTRIVIGRTVQRPDVTVAIEAPAAVWLGETGQVTVQVSNTGIGPTDPDASLTLSSSRDGNGPPDLGLETRDPSCDLDGGRLVCRLGALDPGESTSITAIARADIGPKDATLKVSAGQVPDEIDTADNTAAATVTVRKRPDLSVTLTAPATMGMGLGNGDKVTVSVGNTGSPADARVTVTAPVGSGLVEFATDPPTGCSSVSATELLCSVGDLAPGRGTTWSVPIIGTKEGDAILRADAAVATDETNNANNSASRTIAVKSGINLAPGWLSPGDLGTRTPLWFVEEPVADPGAVAEAARALAKAVSDAAADLVAAAVGVFSHPARAAAGLPTVTRDAPAAPAVGLPSELWVLDAGTGAGARLTQPDPACPPTRACTHVPLVGRVPAWGPDGLRIAYEDAGAIRVAHLRDSDADGTADVPEVVTGVDAVTGFGPNKAPTPNRAILSAATDPAWSPDGIELAVAGTPAGQPQQQGIYALRPDGTGIRTIAQDRGVETEPAWQPYADLSVTLTASPSSMTTGDSSSLTATVTNAGPIAAAAVALRFELPAGLTASAVPPGCTVAGTVVTCDLGTLAKGASANRSVPAGGTVAGDHVVTAVADTPTPDSRPGDNTSAVSVAVIEPLADLAVAIAVTTPGYVGGTGTATFTVTNNGPATATGVSLSVGYPTDQVTVSATPDCLTGSAPCSLGALAPGQNVFAATLAFKLGGSGSVTANVTGVLADPVPENNLATAPLTVKQPTLQLDPLVTAPGGVAIVRGVDFPPGSQVGLAWDSGVTERRGPVTVLDDGTFGPTQVIVFRKDVLGVRRLVATAVVAGQFDPVQAPMLVAPQRASPPDLIERG